MKFDSISHRTICMMLMLIVVLADFVQSQEIYDSQKLTEPLLSPEQARAAFDVPPGFSIDLYASEPDVRQPIGMAWDPRGRLWIAENYTYAESARNFDEGLFDRIVVFEDRDGDGRSDHRKVFWDQAKKLSSIEIGYDGVWALCPPNLLFIPDRNRDDIPDGPPEVILDGFDDDRVRHNLVNGLRWGPDGWLYGRHGILASSRVGVPGQADFERRELNCAIWRYHPKTKAFDVVTEGTTNPWGMDWDRQGHLFFINTVIGHLWHAIPHSHLQRMYGQDLDPFTYELLPQIADHVHWDEKGEVWNTLAKQGLSSGTDAAGGGHAHVGMMIYQGANWPEEYRNQLYTLNLHGRRINQETLERQGAGFVGRHRPDLFRTSDPWFRGIELSSSPDGSVFVLDWSDIGECHENDGVHRGSGRIYRLRFGQPKAFMGDLRQASHHELLTLLDHEDVWFRRMARQLMVERSAAGALDQETLARLSERLQDDDPQLVLEYLWTLYGCGGTTKEQLIGLLHHPNEHVRIWAIKLLLDAPTQDSQVGIAIARSLANEKNDLVKLYAAGCIAKLQSSHVCDSIAILASQKHLSGDRDYSLALWYGIKEHVAAEPQRAATLLNDEVLPKVTLFVARRLASMSEERPDAMNELVTALRKESSSSELRHRILQGISTALRGRRKAPMPTGWTEVVQAFERQGSTESNSMIARLGVIFGQGLAMEQLREMVNDAKAEKAERLAAFASLVEAKVDGLSELAWKLSGDRDLAPSAMRSLSSSGSIDDADRMIANYLKVAPEVQLAIIESLAGNRKFVKVFLGAVESKSIPADHVDAATLRQMQMLGDPTISQEIARIWPHVRLIAGNKLEQIQSLESQLTADFLAQADLKSGRKLWDKHCATCHKLFGEGAAIGPELTGAQRSNLRYVLENIVEPSAAVSDRYRMTLFLLDDGQVVSGVPLEEDPMTVVVQTPKEKITINKSDVMERKASPLSLMPDGLLDSLDANARRDLIAYLMSPTQVR